MPEQMTIIGSPVGLHARPAGLLTKAVSASGIPVWIGRADGKLVDARSILSVMSLAVKTGEQLVLSSADPNAQPLLNELAEMLATAD
jgi:phosphocarrier protein HPr